ncbi:MAG: aminotransferase class IV [Clostridia bacterium]
MIGSSVIRNGTLVSASSAMIPADDPDAFHGYGCYEVLRRRSGILFFPEFHEERLLRSAAILGIQHAIQPGNLVQALHRLVEENGVAECTVKVLLFGRDGRDADWFAFLLPPLYPPDDSSTAGVKCTLFHGERPFPAAKSLGVLVSTLAFRQAKARACWDALLVNRRGEITEGTRTNLCYIDCTGRPDAFTVLTPPAADALEGITRRTLLAALSSAGISSAERPLTIQDALSGRFCLMLTSTSTGVVPIHSLQDALSNGHELPTTPAFGIVRNAYLKYLDGYTERA